VTAIPKTSNLRLAYSLLTLLQQQRGGVRHSRSKGEYIYNANGRTVPDRNIQKRLDGIVDDFQQNTERLANRLDRGNLTIAQWQDRMRREIKDVHRTQYIVGRGGVESMTPRDWGRLGADLRHLHYNKLDKFALEIAEGNLTPAQINARSKLYMNASNKQYWRGKTEAKTAAGFVSKQRFLNPAEHCEDCEDFEAMGRVPINDDSLPPPGEDSVCRSNCKCTMRFYKAGDL
jgi:hypothetical protein